ncbi:MAG: hypothetical protein C0404_06565 [Verrucomicrobia bacterium]|nr:hypothetical protein [Verrucomicrobiota bacterium]
MISYAIATGEMDQLMSRLRRLFDVRITFFDMQKRELEAFHIKSMSPFCALLRRSRSNARFCAACDGQHLDRAKRLRDVHIYHCHSGLIEGMVPLYDRRNIYLGSIVFGQLRDPAHPPSPAWGAELRRRYLKLPEFSVKRAIDIGLLLKELCEYIIANELVRYRNKPWAEKLEDFVERHLPEKITAAHLAREVNRSESFVAHHFQAEFGQTPRQYILKRRMEEARIMIENGESVQRTAGRLGFYDAFHFSKAFRKFWKQPPSTFKPA